MGGASNGNKAAMAAANPAGHGIRPSETEQPVIKSAWDAVEPDMKSLRRDAILTGFLFTASAVCFASGDYFYGTICSLIMAGPALDIRAKWSKLKYSLSCAPPPHP